MQIRVVGGNESVLLELEQTGRSTVRSCHWSRNSGLAAVNRAISVE
jgi:hypothetical protein